MFAFSSSAGNGSTCAVWIWLASICMWWKEAPQSQQQNGFLAAGICLLYSAAKAGLNSILSQVGRCPMMTIIEFMTCFHEFSKFFHQYQKRQLFSDLRKSKQILQNIWYSLISFKQKYNLNMLVWFDMKLFIDFWRFTRIYNDLQHTLTKLFLFWHLLCRTILRATICKNW